MKQGRGFTLIEVLVAMVIIAIAFTAILKATEDTLSSMSHLQARATAHWVAAEILASAQTAALTLPADHREMDGKTLMLGQWYQWHISNQTSHRQNINLLTVSVSQNQDVLYTLTGSLLSNNNPLPSGGLNAPTT